MPDANLILYVASYPDAAAANADYESLKDAEREAGFSVVAAVVASRDAAGDVTVDEHRAASPVAGSAVLGGTAGLVLGLFAPPLLLATAVGAVLGGGIGELVKRHDEKKLGVSVEDYLPPGTSAVIVIADDTYLDRIDRALAKSQKKIDKAIDADDYEQLTKELDAADKRVTDAVDS